MSDELLIHVLKSYVDIKDWDLHNWDIIISRSWKYNEDVTVYPCVYADIYLTEDLEFYSMDAKQPNYSFIEDKDNSDDELLIETLKKYTSNKDWELHDWDSIIERREKISDNIYSYPCVYANILLTEELEFYDAEPKQPIHDDVLVNSLSEDDKLIIQTLRKYIPLKYCEDIDWNTVLSRKEQVKKGVYKYKINDINFYLDEELNPVEYDKVHIIDNKIYYDFDLDPNIMYAPFILFGEL